MNIKYVDLKKDFQANKKKILNTIKNLKNSNEGVNFYVNKNIKEKNVSVYKNQALVIINLGNATGKDILLFSEKIKSTVLEKFDILLEEEVNII